MQNKRKLKFIVEWAWPSFLNKFLWWQGWYINTVKTLICCIPINTDNVNPDLLHCLPLPQHLYYLNIQKIPCYSIINKRPFWNWNPEKLILDIMRGGITLNKRCGRDILHVGPFDCSIVWFSTHWKLLSNIQMPFIIADFHDSYIFCWVLEIYQSWSLFLILSTLLEFP